MNSAGSARVEPFAGLGHAVRRVQTLLGQYLSSELNQFFDLSRVGARRRRLGLIFYGLLFGVVAFGGHMLRQSEAGPWPALYGGLSSLLLAASLTGLRLLLVVGIAAALAQHFVGLFLADIFELKDPRAAWRFAGRLATGAREEVIHLREGRITDADKQSPIIQIGGPGRVVVDYDTAALFEKPDGTPHVIGAADAPGGDPSGAPSGITLEGFERLREPVVSLRDQYIGNPSGEPLTVVGRSLDGMPISVTDVRGVFSVRRHAPRAGDPARPERPFPFIARDIESLIYNQAVAVQTSGEEPSGLPGDWTAAMHVLIRESLREFMSQNRLAEYLAGVGAREAERSEFRADTILSRTLQVASEMPVTGTPAAGSTPAFRPRTELSAKFRKYGSEFSTNAQGLGLELHWIGVGTWKIPDEASETAVSEKHREAWRMNRENAQRLEAQALDRVTQSALLESKIRLIREVPILRHAHNRERYTDKLLLMESMLQDFWEQLGDALEIRYRSGAFSADMEELEQAVREIERLLRISQIGHVLGGKTRSRVRERSDWDRSLQGPPAPTSRMEALQYQKLLTKLGGDYRVAEAMIENEKRRHAGLEREQLIGRIIERFERHGR